MDLTPMHIERITKDVSAGPDYSLSNNFHIELDAHVAA